VLPGFRTVAFASASVLLAVLGMSFVSLGTANAESLPRLGIWQNPPYLTGTWLQKQTAAETQFGAFAGHWRQFKTPSSSGQLSTDEEWALNNGKRLFSNWKVAGSGTWAQTAAGARDAVIVAAAQDWAATCEDNGECWITFHHEPENDIGAAGSGMTAVDYADMQRHVVPLWRTYAPEVKIVWTMMGFEGHRPLYPTLYPGDAYLDYIGHDPYISTTEAPANLANKMITRSQWFTANISASKQFVIPEWGTDLHGGRGTVQHRADAISGVTARLSELAAAGIVELDHFNSREHYLSTADLTGADSAAFKSLKDATEVATSAPAPLPTETTSTPTPTPTPTVTPPVSMSSPADGATVRGTITVNVSSPISSSLRLVRYLRDGVEIARDSTCCLWDEPWNTTNTTDGSHGLTAIASTSTQTFTSAPITVVVDNVSDPSPTPTTTTPAPSPTPTTTTPPPAGDAVLVGAGDIASSNANDEATAVLLDSIPGTVYTTGDNVYDSGTATEFSTYYHPTWGRHKERTRPAPGNHDYQTSGASGYFGYFGAAAGDPARGYYSYDLGAWHVVVINSNVARGAGSAQEQWLRADLATNARPCTVAYWHHPRFTSGSNHPPDTSLGPIVQALYDGNADLVLTGHNHNYERFAPMNASGQLDMVRGIRHFVVGTGGRSHYGFGTPQPNSEVRNSTAYGVLKVTLHDASFDWRFVPIAGQSFTDSGSQSCH